MQNLPAAGPPTGTVTFLFTDVDGSAQSAEEHPDEMPPASSHQQHILREAIQVNGGYAYKIMGDAFQAAFPTAPQAIQAALDAQRSLRSDESSRPGGHPGHLQTTDDPIRAETSSVVRRPSSIVRMALHTGVTEERGDDYVGPLLNRVARLLSAGHGGQILLTLAAAELVRDNLPAGVALKDLGEHRLKDLFRPERVFQLVAPDLPSEFPPLKATPFVGREREVAGVREMLRPEHVRLLTLTGPGGIGKTRLALQAAADLLEEFPDGVFFVPLAAITDPALVIPTIAQTLQVREAGGTPLLDVLKEHLQDKHLLLVLDNFEQVLEAAAPVADLLAAAPQLKVLATSRASLRLSIEQQYPVPPLSLPPTDAGQLPSLERLTQYESVALFISRARAANPTFEVNSQNAPAVAEICVRLDGLPLAIELAAARTRLLSPQAILDRLESRLKLLTGGARDLPARQQTLRNAIEWSYELLTAEERVLFRRLAVFAGGRSLEAIEAVCNAQGDLQIDLLDSVESLVDKSLLGQEEGSGGEPRFVMLETLQEFAREKLQESAELEALEKQHALYFVGFAEQVEPELIGPQQAAWLERLEEDHDNLRAALRWVGETNNPDPDAAETGLRLAGALWRFWYVRGHYTEGRRQLGSILALVDASDQSKIQNPKSKIAKALHGAGVLAQVQGDYAVARSMYEKGLALRRELGDKQGIASLLNNLGLLAYHQGDYASARSLQEEGLAMARELGERWGIASSLNNLGNVAFQQGDYAAARSLGEESLALKRELGDKQGVANTLTNLGLLAFEQGDYPAARSMYEESLALCRELGNKWSIAMALDHLGAVALEQGDHATARSLHQESLVAYRDLADKRGTAFSLHNLGNVAHVQGEYAEARSLNRESLALCRDVGDKKGMAAALAGLGTVAVSEAIAGAGKEALERATRVLGAMEALLESIGTVLDREDRVPYERAVELARSQLGDAEYERLRAEGRAMSPEQAVVYALEEPTTA
jgi:predicted ATPase/class 3 adenylate cyclase